MAVARSRASGLPPTCNGISPPWNTLDTSALSTTLGIDFRMNTGVGGRNRGSEQLARAAISALGAV